MNNQYVKKCSPPPARPSPIDYLMMLSVTGSTIRIKKYTRVFNTFCMQSTRVMKDIIKSQQISSSREKSFVLTALHFIWLTADQFCIELISDCKSQILMELMLIVHLHPLF